VQVCFLWFTTTFYFFFSFGRTVFWGARKKLPAARIARGSFGSMEHHVSFLSLSHQFLLCLFFDYDLRDCLSFVVPMIAGFRESFFCLPDSRFVI